MDKTKLIKESLKYIFTGLIVLLLWKVLKIDWLEFWRQLQQANPYWFSLALILYLTQIFTNTHRWQILLKALDYNLSFTKALKLYFEGSFSNCFMPINAGGDAIRAYKLGQEQGDWMKAASTVLIERILGYTMMLTFIPLGLFFLDVSPQKNLVPIELKYSLIAMFMMIPLAYLSYTLWSRIPIAFIAKLKFTIENYIKQYKSILRMMLWTFITHCLLILANIVVAKSIGIGFDAIPFWYWFLLVPTAAVAGFIVPSVRGMGAKEASYVYVLSFLGISPDAALAIAVLAYSAYMISSSPGITVLWSGRRVQ